MAERGGFEPPVRLLTVQRFSKPPPSATRPSLHQPANFDTKRQGVKGVLNDNFTEIAAGSETEAQFKPARALIRPTPSHLSEIPHFLGRLFRMIQGIALEQDLLQLPGRSRQKRPRACKRFAVPHDGAGAMLQPNYRRLAQRRACRNRVHLQLS